MEPYLRMNVTKNATIIIFANVVKNHASQFMPGRRPIAFIVFKIIHLELIKNKKKCM